GKLPYFILVRGFISRRDAAVRTLTTLRFYWNSKHGPEPEAAGYHGLFYHLLDMKKGRRAKMSELSVFDTAVLLAGAFTASSYFDDETPDENEIRELTEALYRRVDWPWALGGGNILHQYWLPERGFSKNSWKGFNEAFIAYIMAMGSPTFPLQAESYTEWTKTFRMVSSYGFDYLFAGPLLHHQLPHIWLDLKNLSDRFMSEKGTDYFENASKATQVQRQYAIDNPGRFRGYGKNCWGLTYCDGPGPGTMYVRGEERKVFGLAYRGAPDGPDDGTVSPWAAICSLPFAPAIVLPLIEYLFRETDLFIANSYGFRSAYNPSICPKSYNVFGWKSPWHTGINQGPALPMIENYRTGLIWNLMKENQYAAIGLKRAGFEGGWLDKVESSTEERAGYY
ncbi:MAG TPA: glucoamylase family protein, partial [Bacteroidales bacterium]|nr:glucoamylase family protein [Bacteroidales bacterium]